MRQLPAQPSIEQLKTQAKDLLRAQRAGSPQALQRFREFHPKFRRANDTEIAQAWLKLSDAQYAVAREYGFASWPRLKVRVSDPAPVDLSLPQHLRIKDAPFRRAVDLLDTGDVEGLRAYLRANPEIVRRRISFEGGNYFQNPTLLEFVAENPTRHGHLPKNIAEVARVILEAGGKEDRESVDSALDLVASSNVARESGVKSALLDVLCDYGANPGNAHYVAALFGEFDAVRKLVQRGTKIDLLVATELGLIDEAARQLPIADTETRHKALAMAAQHGYVDIARLLLDAGEDPNRFAPVGGHSHSTPLHQAALAGHEPTVRLLVEHGAVTSVRDILHDATPLEWARYAKQSKVAEYLETVTPDEHAD